MNAMSERIKQTIAPIISGDGKSRGRSACGARDETPRCCGRPYSPKTLHPGLHSLAIDVVEGRDVVAHIVAVLDCFCARMR